MKLLFSLLAGTVCATGGTQHYVIDDHPWQIKELRALAMENPNEFFSRLTYFGGERWNGDNSHIHARTIPMPGGYQLIVGFRMSHVFQDTSAYHYVFEITQPNGSKKIFTIRYSDMRRYGFALPYVISGFDGKRSTIFKSKQTQYEDRDAWFRKYFKHPDADNVILLASEAIRVKFGFDEQKHLQNFAKMFVDFIANHFVVNDTNIEDFKDHKIYPTQDDGLCSICLTAPADVAFFSRDESKPCGHLSVCEKCATNLKTCPLCRANIHYTSKVRLVQDPSNADPAEKSTGENGLRGGIHIEHV